MAEIAHDINELPFVSVLIPALNEEEFISACLASLLSQSYPKKRYEIIVMDNGSTDNTVKIALDYDVQVIDASNLKIGAVRNLGAGSANGIIYAFIDADCLAPLDWLTKGVELLLSDDAIGAIGGNCRIRNNCVWVERAWVLDVVTDETKPVKILNSGSFFITKDTFDSVGGFNPNVVAGEDTDISRKLINAGRILLVSGEVFVVHLGYPRTVKSFMARQVWQSSDYVKTKKGRIDVIFLATHLFLFLNIFAVITSINGFYYSGALFFSAGIAMATVLSLYRYTKKRNDFSVSLFFQVLLINYLYLVARSIGLVISYLKALVSLLK